ncbi:MAG: tail fiber protein [Chloroflexia bacterium]
MSDPYIGEIRMFGGTFAPAGWALCQGQLMPISENEALFNLIGTTYGGDGQETFALPDLRSRFPIHMGTGSGTTFTIGEASGVEAVTLNTNQIPGHTHALIASNNNASTANAGNNVLAQTPSYTPYISGFPGNTPMFNQAVSPDGGSQSHTNIQPYLCITFIISLFGIYPTPS